MDKLSTLFEHAVNLGLINGATGVSNKNRPYGNVVPYGSVLPYGGDREQLLLSAIAAMGAFEPVKILPDQIAELQSQLNGMNSKLDLVVTKLENVYFDDVKVLNVKDAYSGESKKKTSSVMQWLKGLFGAKN